MKVRFGKQVDHAGGGIPSHDHLILEVEGTVIGYFHYSSKDNWLDFFTFHTQDEEITWLDPVDLGDTMSILKRLKFTDFYGRLLKEKEEEKDASL